VEFLDEEEGLGPRAIERRRRARQVQIYIYRPTGTDVYRR
jgi:hypothetical protein